MPGQKRRMQLERRAKRAREAEAARRATSDDDAAPAGGVGDSDSKAVDADGEPPARGAHALALEHRVAELGSEVDALRAAQDQLVDGKPTCASSSAPASRPSKGWCASMPAGTTAITVVTVRHKLGEAHTNACLLLYGL